MVAVAAGCEGGGAVFWILLGGAVCGGVAVFWILPVGAVRGGVGAAIELKAFVQCRTR